MKLLIYGDVVGKLGRAGVKLTLPIWKKEFSPDIIIANIENIAHGKGIGLPQILELRDAGVDMFTGGNHSIEGKNAFEILGDETLPLVRPANLSSNIPGKGTLVFQKLLVMNLMGQVNMRHHYDSPFHKADEILKTDEAKTPFKILDWHADATAEKTVMGWYLDGKVSLVFGTHTHVPTADAKILPGGTGYISDIGMVGPLNSIIGVAIEPAFPRFRDQKILPMDVVETGPIEINALFVEIGLNGKTVDIRHLRKIIEEYTI